VRGRGSPEGAYRDHRIVKKRLFICWLVVSIRKGRYSTTFFSDLILIIVILESIPLLHMSKYIFLYQLPPDPSSSFLTPYPQSKP
jgi:hypothetical protein